MSADEILRKARKRFDENLNATKTAREEYAHNADFAMWEKQWVDRIKDAREDKGRPAIVCNNVLPVLNHMVNKNLANRPGISITPADEYGDEDLAQTLMAIIRGIERNSNAGETCYRSAFINFILGGFGFVTLNIQYKGENTFEKEIRFEEVRDPRSIIWDVASFYRGEPFDFAFKVIFYTKDEFKRKYPNRDVASFADNSEWIGYPPFADDAITIVEYWERQQKKAYLYSVSMPNPVTMQNEVRALEEDDLLKEATTYLEAIGEIPDEYGKDDLINGYFDLVGAIELNRRKIQKHKVTRRLLSHNEILEEEVIAGEMIPVIMGHTFFGVSDQNLKFQNLVTSLIGPQSIKNYSISNKAEQIGKGNHRFFIGPRGMVPQDRQNEWSYNNIGDSFYLEYDPDAGPPPQFITATPVTPDPIMGEAWQDIQRLSGVFESQLGSPSNEISGVAINKREEQGLSTNNHFRVALANLIVNLTNCAVGLIVDVYSDNENVDAVNEAENEELIKKPFSGLSEQAKTAKWRTSVVSGPPYATQKEEANDKLLAIVEKQPEALSLLGDILVGNMRFDGVEVVKNRLRSMLPDAIKEAESVQEENPDPSALKMEIASLKQQNEEQKQIIEAGQAKLQELEQATALVKERDQQQFEIKRKELELKEAEVQARLTAEEALKEEELRFNARKIELELNFKSQQNELDRQHALEKIILENKPVSESKSEKVEVEELPSLNLNFNEGEENV